MWSVVNSTAETPLVYTYTSTDNNLFKMEIKLSDYQKVLMERVILAKQDIEKQQEELLNMIFANAKQDRPKTPINYNNGVLSWEVLKVDESLEG